jgi:hypothetical protein
MQYLRSQVKGCGFSPDGSKIVTCSSDNSVRVWDANTSNLIHAMKGHAGYVSEKLGSETRSVVSAFFFFVDILMPVVCLRQLFCDECNKFDDNRYLVVDILPMEARLCRAVLTRQCECGMQTLANSFTQWRVTLLG